MFHLFRARRGLPALALALLILGACHAQDAAPNIFATLRSAVSGGRIDKTTPQGFSIARNHYDEVNVRGGYLIGFDLALRPNSEVINGLRPVYRTASGTSYGREYGHFSQKVREKRITRDKPLRVVRLRAKPGFAVGRVQLRTGLGMDAMALHYHRVVGDRLEATATSRSEWVGNLGGGSPGERSSDGNPIVGVHGNLNDDGNEVIALGLIYARPAASAAAPKPEVRPAPVVKREAPPAEKLQKPEADEPEDQAKDRAPVEKAALAAPPPVKDEASDEEESDGGKRRFPTWLPMAVFAAVFGVIFLPLMFLLGRKKSTAVKPTEGKVALRPKASASPSQVPAPSLGVTTECRATPRTWSTSEEAPPYFSAMTSFVFKPNRLYRIYVQPEELLIVYAGPGNEFEVAGKGVMAGGLIPALIGWMLVGFAKRKKEIHRAALDGASRADLEALVHQGNGYCFRADDVVLARFEAASWWDSLEGRLGRLRLHHRVAGELVFHFVTTEEMRKATEMLPDVLRDRLAVDVVLDRVQMRYVSKY